MKFVLLFAALAVLAFCANASANNDNSLRPHLHKVPVGKVCEDGTTKWVVNPARYVHNHPGTTEGSCSPVVVTLPPPEPVVTVQITRMGSCVDGKFTDLEAGQLAFTDGWYSQATYNGSPVVPANWLQGVGETCDNPLALGFKSAGYLVSDGGDVDLAATQFNIYPYFVKA